MGNGGTGVDLFLSIVSSFTGAFACTFLWPDGGCWIRVILVATLLGSGAYGVTSE